AGFVGVEQAVYSVEDGNGGYAVAYIVVTSKNINPETPNTAPIAKDYNKEIDSKQTPVWDIELTELNLISDADNDELSLVQIFDGNGRAIINGKTGIRYTPGDFIGIDQFTYIISDGRAYAAGTFTLTVSDSTPANQTPTAGRIVASIEEGSTSPITISVAPYVSDPDGDSLRIISLLDAQGLASVSTSSPLEIQYLPNGATILDKFFYVVTDDKGGYAQSSVTVTITNRNPNAPTA
ncbi:cadherin-like domain-containing protein, partial [Shewanella sairae]